MPAEDVVPRSGVRRGVPLPVRWAFGGLAVAALVVAVVRQRHEIAAAVTQLDPAPLAVATALVVAGLVANMLSWRATLAGFGSPLPMGPAARVYLLAQLGKYLPGSIWPVLVQAELGRDHGVPRSRSALAALAAFVIGIDVGVVLTAVTLALSAADTLRAYWWLLLAVPLGSAVLAPPVLNRLLGIGLRLARRPGNPERLAPAALAPAAWWSLVTWLCFGTSTWLIARGIAPGADRLWLLAVGGYTVAWIAGFLFVLAPAGAGAREAALVLVLATAMPHSDAFAVAVVSRVLMLAGDLVAAGIALAARRR
ncbi:MAG: flippase-like domain-containing protein [Actinomycetota bacterium]|nr:flippase-like domain-containing protein [Actinomycetota bacterium]